MNVVGKWIGRFKARLTPMSRRARLAAAALAAVTVLAMVWLVVEATSDEMVEVASVPLGRDELARARQVLDARGIRSRVERGRLLVPTVDLAGASEVLREAGLGCASTQDTFRELVAEADVWSTRAGREKRWQAEKMAVLGEKIGGFTQVRKAMVIFEPGSTSRLGGRSRRPTAMVHVELEPGAGLSDTLCAAIADMIAGVVPSMRRDDVRIVDGRGVSRRVAEAHPSDGAGAAIAASEVYFAGKIRSALAYAGEVSVDVTAVDAKPMPRCVAATVSLPRSYLNRIEQAARAERPDISANEMRAICSAEAERVRRVVARVLRTGDPAAVHVDWHFDKPAQPAETNGTPAKTASAGWAFEYAAMMLALVMVAVASAGGVVFWRRMRAHLRERRARAPAASAGTGTRPPAGRQPQRSDRPGRPFGVLDNLPAEEVLTMIRDEHPQTLALILSHVEESRAAHLLAGLPAERQVEVTARVARLESVDPSVVRQIERDLAGRLAEATAGEDSSVNGLGKVAEILHRSPGAAEGSILSGLSQTEPALAEAIRKRMFVFEDLAELPPSRLRACLGEMDTTELAVALRTASKGLQKKLLSTLPSAAARAVRDEMQRMGPVRLSDVEATQRRVVEAVRRLDQGLYEPAGAEETDELVA